jgi:hypothetical protein
MAKMTFSAWSAAAVLLLGNSLWAVPAGAQTITTLGGNFYWPTGVAADHYGNTYVADMFNGVVKEIPVTAGAVSPIILGNAIVPISGVSVESKGDVIVADTGNNAVKEILVTGGYTTAEVLQGALDAPLGAALDKNGDLFVVDGDALPEYLASDGYANGNYLPTDAYPSRIALDADGNVFVACTGMTFLPQRAGGRCERPRPCRR